jgi:hypothetical protein
MDCPCQHLPAFPLKTDHEDELVVLSKPVTLQHHCRSCGRKFDVQYIPGDFFLGENPVSRGYRGAPLVTRPKKS